MQNEEALKNGNNDDEDCIMENSDDERCKIDELDDDSFEDL